MRTVMHLRLNLFLQEQVSLLIPGAFAIACSIDTCISFARHDESATFSARIYNLSIGGTCHVVLIGAPAARSGEAIAGDIFLGHLFRLLAQVEAVECLIALSKKVSDSRSKSVWVVAEDQVQISASMVHNLLALLDERLDRLIQLGARQPSDQEEVAAREV